MWPGLPFVPAQDRPRLGIHLPEGAAQLNREHRAAPLVEGLYLFTGPAPEAVVPGYGPMAVKAGTPVRSAGAVGGFTSYTAVSGHVATASPSGDISVVAVAMRGITAGGAAFVSAVQVVASSINVYAATRQGFELSVGNDYLGAARNRMTAAYYDAGGAAITAAGMWVNGSRETISGGAGSTDLANGVFYAIGATFPAVRPGNVPLTVGDFGDNVFALTGGVAMVAVFRGILQDELMADLTAEPSALLLFGPQPERGLRTWLGRLWATVRPFLFRH